MPTRRAFLHGSLAAAALTLGRPRALAAPPKPLKLLILGGTRFLGPALVAAARARGHTLTLFNRGKTNPGRFPDLEQLHGDRDGKLEALAGRRWDAVIDDSGYVPRHVRDSARLLAPQVGYYLFVSTVSVYADTSKPVDERSPLATLKEPTEKVSDGSYGALKALCEKEAEAAFPGRAGIVRPGLIVGPDDPTDRFTYWPLRVSRGGEVLAPGAASDPILYIDVRDLASWMIALAEKHVSGTFNALGPAGALGMGPFLDGIKQGVRGDARFTWVDTAFLDKHNVQPWSDMPVWVPPVGEGAYMGRISRARAVQAGLTFRPVAETARDTLAWWNELPAERRAKLRAGLPTEREREVLAAWHART
jgi:2'-hydroxyisoflavone reductase